MFPHSGLGLLRGLAALLATVKTFPVRWALAWPIKKEVRKELKHTITVLKIQVPICQKAARGINQQCPGLAPFSLSLFGLSNSWQFNNIFLASSRSYSLVLYYSRFILAFPAQARDGLPSLYDRLVMYAMLSVYSVYLEGGDQDNAKWPC